MNPKGRRQNNRKRSLKAMDEGICNGDHLPANQSPPNIAPYPTEPAASEETWRSGLEAQRGDNRKLYPFHDWKNSSHHDKSKWNSLLSLMGWSSLRKIDGRLIIRRTKVWRSEGTTLHAFWRLLIKNSNSFCVQRRFCDQETSSVWIRSNFFLRGRRAYNRRESTSMPKTVRRVEGPSNLSEWRGIPQFPNCWIQVSRLRWHVWELGRPKVWKSSK